MPKRSREADVARAEKHAEKRADGFLHDLNNPDTPQATKEAIASRLANALAGANGNRPKLVLVDKMSTSEISAPDTTADTDVFEQELDKIFNPPYASQEWIKDVEGLFSEPQTRVHHPAHPKSFLQKMKPAKPGRYAKESEPGRLKKVWLALGSVASSLAVKNSPFSSTDPEDLAVVSVPKQSLTSRHTKGSLNTRHESTYPERRKSRKNLRAISAMVATTAIMAGVLFATNGENNEPYEGRREAAARTYENPALQPEVQSEDIVDTAPTPENQVMDETQSPSPAETVTTPTSFTITIENGGNIWDATKAELQKSNPDVTNQEVARMVNRIIIENNLNTPDLVYAGNTFTISN